MGYFSFNNIDMLSKFHFSSFVTDFMNAMEAIRETIPFIKKNKLWNGFFENKWVLVMTVIISILFSYIMYDNLIPVDAEALDAAANMGMSVDVKDMVNDVKSGSQKTVFSSGTKYLLFILLEVIIFHFAVRTLSILRGTKREISLNDFFKAEKRMIILMGINFIKGIVAYIVVTVALSIVGFNSYTPFVMFFVYAYFIGFGFLDNYNEQFGKTMNQSLVIVRQHVGASTAIGLLISGLLFIPFIGPLFSPIFGAIAATIYGERYKIELSPIIESS